MGNCEYVREYYNVPACIGRKVVFQGRPGIIAEDRGNYIGVNFDDDKPGIVYNVHPTDNVEYGEMGTIRIKKETRSQKRYQEYLNADFGCSFREWLGIRPDGCHNCRFKKNSYWRENECRGCICQSNWKKKIKNNPVNPVENEGG